MATVFCLDRQGHLMQVDDWQCNSWLAEMFATAAPEAAQWYQVPANLLAPNMSVAYFSAYAWLAANYGGEDQEVSADSSSDEEEEEDRPEFVPFSGQGHTLKKKQ